MSITYGPTTTTSTSVTFNPGPPGYTTGSHSHSFTQPLGGEWGRAIDQMMQYPQKYQAKERTMTTLEKVRAERDEARERARIETLYAAWDEEALTDQDDGTVLRFHWKPKETTYTYAVLRADGRWWSTGHNCSGLRDEDFVAWLISKDIGPDDVEWLS